MSDFEPTARHDIGLTELDAATTSPELERLTHPGSRQRRRTFWESLGRDAAVPVLFGLLLAAVFGVIGALASLGGSTTYTSRTVMLIDDPNGLAMAGDQGEFVKLDALRFKYAGLVDTNAIAQPVASRLNVPLGDVVGAVSTQVPYESLLMDVDATSATPQKAQQISQAVADQITAYVRTEDSAYKIPAAQAFSFATVDPAAAPVAHHPSQGRAVTLALGLAVVGFILGFLATQLVRYLR